MKKVFAIILVLATTLTLWACSLFTSNKTEDPLPRPGLIDETEGDGTNPAQSTPVPDTTPDGTEGTEKPDDGTTPQGTTAPTTTPTTKPTTTPTTKPTTAPTTKPTEAPTPTTRPVSNAAPEAPVLPGDISIPLD